MLVDLFVREARIPFEIPFDKASVISTKPYHTLLLGPLTLIPQVHAEHAGADHLLLKKLVDEDITRLLWTGFRAQAEEPVRDQALQVFGLENVQEMHFLGDLSLCSRIRDEGHRVFC